MEPNNMQSDYISSYEDLEVHRLMLEDEHRTLTYKTAILNNAAYLKDKVVMDVGCGTGILSIFCAQAGAKKVYAVEASNVALLAKEIVRENKYEDIIEVIQAKVENVILPNNIKVDAIVSEWMGFYLLHEGMLDSVIIARDKFLKPGGFMFPENATIYASPSCVPTLYGKWDNFHGVSMAPLAKRLRVSKYNKPEIMTVNADDIIGKDNVALAWINLNEDTVEDLNYFGLEHVVGAKRNGEYQGLCVWFECSFPDTSNKHNNIKLVTAPSTPATHWKQTVIVLPDSQPVEEGDPIAFQIKMTRDEENSRRYNIEVTLLDPDDDAVEHPLPCTCNMTKCLLINTHMQLHPEVSKVANGLELEESEEGCVNEDPEDD